MKILSLIDNIPFCSLTSNTARSGSFMDCFTWEIRHGKYNTYPNIDKYGLGLAMYRLNNNVVYF